MQRPDAAVARERIADIISRSVYHALGLLETLEAEHEALTVQDLTAIEDALEQKGDCVRELRDLEQERSALCSAHGFPAAPDQMDRVVAWCDEDSQLESGWQHLMDIATKCSNRNITNGAIIRGRKRQIEAGIAAIRGSEPMQDTYGRNGSEPSAYNRRSIAEV